METTLTEKDKLRRLIELAVKNGYELPIIFRDGFIKDPLTLAETTISMGYLTYIIFDEQSLFFKALYPSNEDVCKRCGSVVDIYGDEYEVYFDCGKCDDTYLFTQNSLHIWEYKKMQCVVAEDYIAWIYDDLFNQK